MKIISLTSANFFQRILIITQMKIGKALNQTKNEEVQISEILKEYFEILNSSSASIIRPIVTFNNINLICMKQNN